MITLAYMTMRTVKKGLDVHRQEEKAALVSMALALPTSHPHAHRC